MPRALNFHSIEVFADGRKTLRLHKVVDEAGDILLDEPHIFQFEAGETVAQAAARLRASLGTKWPELSAADKVRIKAIADAAG